ncbi:MAG: hypothetical protein ACRCXY_11390 [Fusobacteriaceae bacterium]
MEFTDYIYFTNGINLKNKKIEDLLAGVNDNDATNLKQVKDLIAAIPGSSIVGANNT